MLGGLQSVWRSAAIRSKHLAKSIADSLANPPPLPPNAVTYFALYLICFAGTSAGDVTIWSADPSAAAASSGTAQQTLTCLGTALLPDRQPALVLSTAVVAAAAHPAAAAAAVEAGVDAAAAGWQLLLAAGKNLGSISVWRSGAVVSDGVSDTAAGYSRQQLSLAVSTGESSCRRCHGVGFVTGVLWSPLEQQLSSCGADGQLLSWVWAKGGLQVRRVRFSGCIVD